MPKHRRSYDLNREKYPAMRSSNLSAAEVEQSSKIHEGMQALDEGIDSSDFTLSVRKIEEITDDDDDDDLACEWGEKCGDPPPCCSRFRDAKCVLVWLCLASATQSMVVNGFVNSSITSLEKRHGISSLESGAIASFYDIGVLICLVPVSYFGSNGRKPRWIAIGMLIMGFGSLLYALPHFTTGKYQYTTPVDAICYISPMSYPDFCMTAGLAESNYKYVFYLGQLMHGIGASPFYTLGVAYLDDNLSTANSALYIGVFYCMSLLGPALGYLLGGMFLKLYVDVGDPHPGLLPDNTSLWIGAWWIGFLLCAALAWIGVIPTYGFPKSLPGSAAIRANKKDESYETNKKHKVEAETKGLKNFLQSVRVILVNPTFVFISISGAIESQLVAGFSTFGPKMIETLYSVEASWATMLMGITTIPTGGIGMLLGGLIIKLTNMSIKKVLWMIVIFCSVGMICVCCFFIKCEGIDFVGISKVYDKPNNLTFPCNANCQCRESKFMYAPVCGANNKMYFSACYAGCKTNFTGSDSALYYKDCACVSDTGKFDNRTYSAKAGSCSLDDCNRLLPFLVLFGVLIFMTFFIATPSMSVTMRSVPEKHKSLALGVQWIIIRLFGSIPSPLYFGFLIDNTCSLWSGGCGTQKGSCSRYNGNKLQLTLLIVGFVGKFLSLIALLLATWLYRSDTEQGCLAKLCSSPAEEEDEEDYSVSGHMSTPSVTASPKNPDDAVGYENKAYDSPEPKY